MKSKNVLVTIPYLVIGGTEIQTLNLVRALIDGGYNVSVLCLYRHIESTVSLFKDAGAKVYMASPQYDRYGIDIKYPKGLRLILFLYKHLRKIIRKEKIDIVHVQYMAPGLSMIMVLRYLLFHRNIIATAHTAADIYKNLRPIHFIQRHCLRAFTCITERAERSFFGSSQLYTTETVLGRRNHFTIYNALPKATALQSTVKVCANERNASSLAISQRVQPKLYDEVTNSQQTGLPDENFGLTQTSQTDTDAINAANISQHELSTNPQNGKSLRPCCLPDENLGLTQTSQTDTDAINAANISQQNLDTKTQNGKSLRPCCHPDGNCPPRLGVTSEAEGVFSKHYTLTTQRSESNICSHNIAEQASGLKCKAFINSKPNTIGVVSRLEPIKGMDLVVPAFAEVLKQYPEVRLLVVGDGSLRATMEQQAVELGCADRITWVGRQPQEELAQWYAQMDIVLMPSRSEGFGLTAIEAMANGCVMVAADVGGLPEVVRDGVCGLLHRTEDVHDMAAKVCMLLGDNELYNRLRTQALCEVEKYSFERYAALVNNLYGKLVLSFEQ